MNKQQELLKTIYNVAATAHLSKADHVQLEKIYLELDEYFRSNNESSPSDHE